MVRARLHTGHITTTSDAAAAILRMYEILNAAAVLLSEEYICQRLEGEEGKTWKAIEGYTSCKFPVLDKVMRNSSDEILLMSVHFGGVVSDYKIYQAILKFADNSGTPVEVECIVVDQRKIGYAPGSKFAVIPSVKNVFEAGSDGVMYPVGTISDDLRAALYEMLICVGLPPAHN